MTRRPRLKGRVRRMRFQASGASLCVRRYPWKMLRRLKTAAGVR